MPPQPNDAYWEHFAEREFGLLVFPDEAPDGLPTPPLPLPRPPPPPRSAQYTRFWAMQQEINLTSLASARTNATIFQQTVSRTCQIPGIPRTGRYTMSPYFRSSQTHSPVPDQVLIERRQLDCRRRSQAKADARRIQAAREQARRASSCLLHPAPPRTNAGPRPISRAHRAPAPSLPEVSLALAASARARARVRGMALPGQRRRAAYVDPLPPVGDVDTDLVRSWLYGQRPALGWKMDRAGDDRAYDIAEDEDGARNVGGEASRKRQRTGNPRRRGEGGSETGVLQDRVSLAGDALQPGTLPSERRLVSALPTEADADADAGQENIPPPEVVVLLQLKDPGNSPPKFIKRGKEVPRPLPLPPPPSLGKRQGQRTDIRDKKLREEKEKEHEKDKEKERK